MPMLDKVDTKLLHLLQKDATYSNKVLAKKLNISQATCHHHIQKLHDKNYINLLKLI